MTLLRNTPDGGSAFPEVLSTFHEGGRGTPGYLTDVYSTGGMTLRDYFAAKAMQALLSGGGLIDGQDTARITNAAYQAYLLADAMLKAREA